MLRISKENKAAVLEQVRMGNIDAASLSVSGLVDDVIRAMKKNNILDCLVEGFEDKRADNTTVPFDIVMALAIAAKMRIHSSLSDIPFALTDHRTICELGYSMVDPDGLENGLMTEGTIRHMIGKYEPQELFTAYNKTVQQHIIPKQDIESNIHILDCTKLRVNLKNENYESSGIVRDEDGVSRGYKLSTIRGIIGDSGIIEEIAFGSINTHDMTLSRDMLLNTPMLKPGDILINDRGFLSREMINILKRRRGVDTYVPLKKNMAAHEAAMRMAKDWTPHPSRSKQEIAFVPDVGVHWQFDENDVDLNACVVRSDDFCAVFVTTDTSKTATDIIKTYELRPEIEEDYRQLKDFWKLEDFKSTKLNTIAFHIVCVLLGYLFFQLYTFMPEGDLLAGKSFPVLLKTYKSIAHPMVVVYVDDFYGVLSLVELMDLYADVSGEIRGIIAQILED